MTTSNLAPAALRRVLLTLAICALYIGLPTVTIAEEFRSKAYGYTVKSADDWVAMPPGLVKALKEGMHRAGEPRLFVYEAGFQPAVGRQPLATSYLLVKPLPLSRIGRYAQVNEDEFARVARKLTGRRKVKNTDASPSEIAAQTPQRSERDTVLLDATNRRYIAHWRGEAPGIGSVRGIAVGYFGREAIIHLEFVSQEADWEGTIQGALTIIESFRFQPGKEYSEALAAANPTRSRGGILPILDVIAIGIGVGLGAKLLLIAIRRLRAG